MTMREYVINTIDCPVVNGDLGTYLVVVRLMWWGTRYRSKSN